MRPACLLSVVALAVLPASAVRADAFPFRGPHPIDLDGHWHDDSSVHVHDQLPVGFSEFDNVEGVWLFLGDPTSYAYTGSVWTYAGAHPLPYAMPGYCSIEGLHRHPFAPEGNYARQQDGSYAFASPMRGGTQSYGPGRPSERSVLDVSRVSAASTMPVGFTPWCQPLISPDGTVTFWSPDPHGGPCIAPPSYVSPYGSRPRSDDSASSPPPPARPVHVVLERPRLSPRPLPRPRPIDPGPIQ